MDDKTIFQNQQSENINPQPNVSQNSNQNLGNPEAFRTQQQPQVVIETHPSTQSPQVVNEHSSGGGPFSPKNILKLLIGFFVVAIVMVVLFVFILPNTNKQSKKVVLSYWGVLEDPQAMTSTISDFEKQNPNITIDYRKQDINTYREKLTTQISQGTGPDIFSFHNTWYPMFSTILLPLPKDTIPADIFNKSFYPVAKQDLVKNGAIYGIPLEVDTLSLFINSDLFKAQNLSAPTNWNDFITTARALTIKDQDGKIATSGAAFGTFDNITHAPDIISLLFVQDGVNLGDLSLNKQRISDALSFYTAFAQGTGNVWDNTLDQSLLSFSKGNVAMYFGYYWDYFTVKSQNPNLNFQIVPVPQLSFPNKNIASYWAEGVSSKSKNQKEALLFMKYLSQRQTQGKIYQDQAKIRIYGEPPALIDLSGELKGTPVYSFVSQAQNAASSYFAGETFDKGINANSNAALSKAINSILNGSGSSDTSANILIQDISQIFQIPANK